MLNIVEIKKSPNKNKRYRIFLSNGKHYDFGLETGSTYIDHKDKIKRKNYWSRHYTGREKKLIDDLTPSPALFSAYILWGNHTDIDKNIDELNSVLGQEGRELKIGGEIPDDFFDTPLSGSISFPHLL